MISSHRVRSSSINVGYIVVAVSEASTTVDEPYDEAAVQYSPSVSSDKTAERLAEPPLACSSARLRPMGFGAAAFTRFASEGWWARQDSNLQPDRYERPCLLDSLGEH